MHKVLVILALVALSVIAEARPGGGQSSSGGGRSSSSSSSSSRSSSSSSSSSRSSSSSSSSGGSYGGGSDAGVGVLLFTFFLVGGGILALVLYVKKRQEDWNSRVVSTPAPKSPPPDLSLLRARDPDLSIPVLEDFLYRLYSLAQRRRGSAAELMSLQPWLSDAVISKLLPRDGTPTQVVIGTLRLDEYVHDPKHECDVLGFEIEATLFTDPPRYITEGWMLVRSDKAVSKPPTATRTWPCPNCGATWQGNPDRKCQHCGETMTAGRFDWFVADLMVLSEKDVLASLAGTVEEYGNDLPTIYRPDAKPLMDAIAAEDPACTFAAVCARIALIYGKLNEGWNAGDMTLTRGLTTAALRDYLDYWLREYRRQGLRNRLDGAAVQHLELTKVVRDRQFDAITVRVRAGGCDYTLDDKGSVVGGSKTKVRNYTEYWTVLRSSARRGPVTATPTCPSCGAVLSIGDAGACTHCNAMVENGQFDWILSKIEQDDTYQG